MNLMAVVIYNNRGGAQDRLEKQLAAEKIPLLSLTIHPFSWRLRYLATMEIAARYPDHTLIFLDAWDTLFPGNREELEMLPLDEGITFAAQKFCWPDKTREAEYDAIQGVLRFKGAPVIPDDIGPWRFINSNPMAGTGKEIWAALEWAWQQWPIKTNTNSTVEYDVDERLLTHLYLSRGREIFNIKLDHKCELNQTFLASVPGDLIQSDGRVTNLIHNTRPQFFHANGRSDIPEGLLYD